MKYADFKLFSLAIRKIGKDNLIIVLLQDPNIQRSFIHQGIIFDHKTFVKRNPDNLQIYCCPTNVIYSIACYSGLKAYCVLLGLTALCSYAFKVWLKKYRKDSISIPLNYLNHYFFVHKMKEAKKALHLKYNELELLKFSIIYRKVSYKKNY